MMAKRAEVDNDEDLCAIIENPVSNVCGNGFPDTDHDLKSTNGNKSSSKVRVPVQYHSINATSLSASSSWTDPADNNVDALVSRYKYYSRLDAHRDSSLRMPDHVVPPSFMITILIPTRGGKQSSLVTIFALWNTMMGTSLLSMPWAIRQAGFITGILLLLAMSGLMLYTSYRIMNSARSIGEDSAIVEFSDVCRFYLGRWADICSTVFSLATLLGGAIVYWILMTNFLYNTVAFIYDKVNNSSVMFPTINSSANYDAICPAITGGYIHMTNITVYNQESHHWIIEVFQDTGRSVFEQVWDLQKTVPFFLLIILTPLINFKSPTFFTKFNSLGTLCVFCLLGFVIAKAAKWGINMDWNPADSGDDYYVHAFKPTFPALTGIASLAFFIHNAVLSVMRNQKHPENNARDLTLAYCLVTLTYLIVGVTFYMTFPDAKNCIEDNLLNNIMSGDILAFVARIFLFLQMVTVFPLLLYIFRAQLLYSVCGSVWPSWKHVLLLNAVLVVVCSLFARFLPHIGKIISFVGAFCGFAYALALPCMVHIMSQNQNGTLTKLSLVIHAAIILFGFLNFIAQFVLLGIGQ